MLGWSGNEAKMVLECGLGTMLGWSANEAGKVRG